MQNTTFAQVAAPVLLACLTDSVLNVRVKAAWGLSNLCDTGDSRAVTGSSVVVDTHVATPGASTGTGAFTAPPSSHATTAVRFRKLLPAAMSRDVCRGLLSAVHDHDKVCCSAIRGLGCIGRWMFDGEGFAEAPSEAQPRSPPAASPTLTPTGLLRPAALEEAAAPPALPTGTGVAAAAGSHQPGGRPPPRVAHGAARIRARRSAARQPRARQHAGPITRARRSVGGGAR